MAETVRFAPSPTGEIHIGNLRTALYNAFLALSTGGRFVLRFDDTDAVRSEARYAAQIEADLAFVGIRPDVMVRQSERLALYDGAAERLRDAGLLYPAYETADELERKRSLQRARGRPPVYDRAALALGADERAALEREGRRPHWRFRLPEGERRWDDLCRGSQVVDLATLSDPVLIRADGSYLYALPSVVDDAELGVTSVVRGEDHVTNTAVQIALFEALGVSPPRFAHHNLIVRRDGEPLSKRDNPLSIGRLAADGIEPMALAALAALTGTSRPVEPADSLATLAGSFDLRDVSRAPATFDPADLDRLNALIIHKMPFDTARDRLAGFGGDDPAFWELVRPNIERVEDAREWASVWHERPAPPGLDDEGRRVAAVALERLPVAGFGPDDWSSWTAEVRNVTGAKGRSLFRPLRLALTGRGDGPELRPYAALLGRDEDAARLAAAAALVPSDG